MSKTVKLTGFRELHSALGELTKSTERGLLRRMAKKALEPMQAEAKRLVPVDEGHLRDSIVIGTRLTRRAKKAARNMPAGAVRLFMGSADRNAVPREFGTVRSAAQPFMRPAWDTGHEDALELIKRELGSEIEKTAARVAKRKAGI